MSIMSMLILPTMQTEIRVYIFKTFQFQPKFQLIKLRWEGGRVLSMMVFKIMRFLIIFCITSRLSDQILLVTS